MVLQKGGPGARKRGGHFFCPKNLATPKKKLSLSIEYMIPTFVLKLRQRGHRHAATM